MAGAKKKPTAVVAAQPAKPTKTIKRSRTRALDRRTLSKAAKRMLVGANRQIFRDQLAAETTARRKTSGTPA